MKIVRYAICVLIISSFQFQLHAGTVPGSTSGHASIQQPVITTGGMSGSNIRTVTIAQDRDPVKNIKIARRRERVKETVITTGAVIYVICEIIVDILIDYNCHKHH